MNTKFIFTLSIVILSLILSAVAHDNEECHYVKRSPELFERHDYENNDTCPCTVATATFTDKVTGIVVFAQDPCGSTLVTGLFSDGLVDPDKNCYSFRIVDKCGKLLNDLTSALNVKFRNNGTFPFSVRIDDLNLNCDSDGVLLAESDKKRYVKRDTGADLQIQQNGQNYASAPLSSV
ncbi:hypothetical protein Glove_99g121 [Diversispora epigaea]|uniref:Uncharacterized protein n=1 Tax=Diversispora epigaea TaxID=1348612 RepID=A0A397J6P8_9GLOM|nr:hypothetical protein Glove_99g121 [Diversispora epigaea]